MDHESGNSNKFDERAEEGNLIVEDFDYTEETDSFYTENQFVNLDGDTEKLDITDFVGDLRALMVDDSEDEVVLDSDDEKLSERKDGNIRGSLWRRASTGSTPSVEIRSSAGSNLTDKVTDNGPVRISIENDLLSNYDKVVNVDKIESTDLDRKSLKEDKIVIESQEPGEESQANALNFVDQFVLISVENSSSEFKIPKIDALRSPLSSCAKGSYSLARKTSLIDKIGNTTFDWDDDNQPDHGGEFFLKKRKEFNFEREEQLNEELLKCPSISGGNERDRVDMFDVGFDTQMAAEVIESLLYFPPPIIDANEHKDLENRTSKHILSPLRDNIDSQNSGRRLNRKIVAKNQMEVNIESPGTKKTKNRESSNKKRKAKRKQEDDSEKENFEGGYKRRKSVRKLHREEKTFSPVACRTRRGSLLKHSKRIEDTCNLVHERLTGDLDEDLLLVKRTRCPNAVATSDLFKFSIWNWPKKKRSSRNMKQNSVVENRRRLLKKKSPSSSLRNDLTKLGLAESSPDFTSKDLRIRRSKVEIRVMLSQNLEDDVVKQQRKIMTELGISIATDCSDATHFVADRFARTKTMLEAMAFGKLVVTPLWLESCEQTRCIIHEKNYILKDAKKEKEIGFNMTVSLSRARSYPLLKDWRVFITPNVEPDRITIRNLVKAVQGQVIEGIQQASMDYKNFDNILIVSCEYDYEVCVPFLDKGAAVYSSELLLNGIIIQKLEYLRHQLFTDHVIMKRYTRRLKNGTQQLLGS